ncbi:MAG: alpha/beta hydrolase [Firmicutes bacterium]|nr:alpha/beta hydrolase [Bacillota bacterium]
MGKMDRITAYNYYSDFWRNHSLKEIDFKGKNWNYIACGVKTGKTFVFLHGGGLDAGMWSYQINELEKCYKIIAPSFELIPDSFRLRSEVIEYILKEEKAEHVILCGHSYGGILAQYFISIFPESAEKIILAHTFFPTKDFIERIKGKKINVLKYIPGFVIKMAFKRRMKYCQDSQYNEFRNTYLNNLYSGIDHKSLMGFYTSFVDRLKEELPDTANWKGEILLINSKDDNDTIDKYEELIAAYPGAKTHLFESGAHHTPLLFPEEFTKIISEFAN